MFPELAAQWHPEKNNEVTPDQVYAGGEKRFWWVCPKGPDHEWRALVNSRTTSKNNGRTIGSGCPYCRGLQVSVTNSLASLFPDVAALWHPEKNGDVTPGQVVAGTNKKYWLKCPKGPDHEWYKNLWDQTYRGEGCPFCRGMKVSATNSLASLFPEVSAEWHPEMNGDVTPDQVIAGSHKKFWWKCPNGQDHEWLASAHNRTGNSTGCAYCTLMPRSRPEIELAFELLIFFDYDIDDHKERAGNHLYDCDIIVRQHGLIVEYDGSYWHAGTEQADIEKTNVLRESGWHIIRVREEPLPSLSPTDVSIRSGRDMKPAADAVLLKIQESLDIQIDGLGDYLKETELQNRNACERHIKRLLQLKRERELTS
jgi:hypothetical protein